MIAKIVKAIFAKINGNLEFGDAGYFYNERVVTIKLKLSGKGS